MFFSAPRLKLAKKILVLQGGKKFYFPPRGLILNLCGGGIWIFVEPFGTNFFGHPQKKSFGEKGPGYKMFHAGFLPFKFQPPPGA